MDVTGNRSATLKPGEFRIYSTRRLETPPEGLLTVGAEQGGLPPVRELNLEKPFPNPSSESTVLTIQLPEASEMRLVVCDLLRCRVATLARGHYRSGSHLVQFEAALLPTGLYFARLQTKGRTASQPTLHVR